MRANTSKSGICCTYMLARIAEKDNYNLRFFGRSSQNGCPPKSCNLHKVTCTFCGSAPHFTAPRDQFTGSTRNKAPSPIAPRGVAEKLSLRYGIYADLTVSSHEPMFGLADARPDSAKYCTRKTQKQIMWKGRAQTDLNGGRPHFLLKPVRWADF